jgi:organic radical activating enzyme
MDTKFFPIKTDTACQLKWAWSTVYLNTSTTRSCHRTGQSELNVDNFFNFHNTPLKISDREKMLQGEWPESSCKYCKDIEERGGISDRLRMLSIPDLSPPELFENPTATTIDPTIMEVYFNNTCNLGCLYCGSYLSSYIESENKKFGDFNQGRVDIKVKSGNFKNLVPYFWKWFDQSFHKVKRFHVLGGEPFYQKDFDKLIDKIMENPNPNCELNIVTNLMVPKERLLTYIEKFRAMLVKKSIKRIDITCSIDCWGAEQEYVRWGLKLNTWEENFQILLDKKWLTLNINQTISPLSIKTMPDLLERLNQWRQKHPVGHYFSAVFPGPDYMKLDVIGNNFFNDDIVKIMNLMPMTTQEDILAKQYMQGILSETTIKQTNFDLLKDLIIYLDEKDRRRNTHWREVFPWLCEIEKNVV